MFILNRPARMIGAGIGFAKEYNADRKAQKAANENHEGTVNQTGEADEDDDGHEWAQAIDEAQGESRPDPGAANAEDQSEGDLIADFIQRHPPPPYVQDQPIGTLPLPVILPQRRPRQRTRGWVRAYAPVLADAGVDQAAWFDFLDGFERSVSKNNMFWAANAAVWVADKAYIISTGNPWVEPIVIAIHLSVEAGRRGYLHNQHNKWLDEMNDQYFKPRGLFALIVKYKPEDMNEVGGWVDVRSNVTESVTRRDDPSRPEWKNIVQGSADKIASDDQMPEFAPLEFPFFNEKNAEQQESAWKHFQKFRMEYQDRAGAAEFQAQNPDSRLGGVAPQKQYASRYSNPNHPARQGLIGLVTGGKANPSKGIIRGHGGGREELVASAEQQNSSNAVEKPNQDNVANDGVNRDEVAWQAVRTRAPRGPRRILRQDVLYLMVVNMPSEEEMARTRQKLGIQG